MSIFYTVSGTKTNTACLINLIYTWKMITAAILIFALAAKRIAALVLAIIK